LARRQRVHYKVSAVAVETDLAGVDAVRPGAVLRRGALGIGSAAAAVRGRVAGAEPGGALRDVGGDCWPIRVGAIALRTGAYLE